MNHPNRKENNELINMPGFFFHPLDKDDLEELSDGERSACLEHILGHYLLPVPSPIFNKGEYTDFLCFMDSNGAPTHRKTLTPFPWKTKEIVELSLEQVQRIVDQIEYTGGISETMRDQILKYPAIDFIGNKGLS